MRKRLWKQQILGFSVGTILGISGGWFAWNAIAPLPVHAYVARTSVVLDVQAGESYSAFLSRAETVARAAVQRNFDRDILISEVYIVMVGQRQGQATPVLSVRVSRNQWRSRPDSRRWATYFPTARTLLGFGTSPAKPTPPAATASPTPAPTPTVNPPATPSTNPASGPPPANSPTPEPPSPLEQLLPQAEPIQPGTNSPTQTPGTTPLPPPGSPR
ncbi:MAG: hypothetical protein NW224_03760 [Leptolyngbyaceae cyanobacterium bins.302]|nr:hypothetical protein [Leptolyngbyaceae cyanobacterium bins.302]